MSARFEQTQSAASATESAAAQWYVAVELGEPGPAQRQALAAWLGADAEHGHAYAQYAKLWAGLGPLGSHPRIAALRGAMAARPPRLHRALAAGLVAAALGGLWVAARLTAWSPGGGEVIATAIGERSAVSLEDGSRIALNTNSAVRPLYSARERAVRLQRGQAWFEVAKDPARPFVVYAGGRRIVALGTSFDVRLEAEGVSVTLVEGRVAVSSERDEAAGVARAAELSPGQQLRARGSEIRIAGADLAAVAGWREGRLIFSGDALADAVAEVNRYSHVQIVLADADSGQLRLSGVFRAGQTHGFLAALQMRFDLQVIERDAERIVLARRVEQK